MLYGLYSYLFALTLPRWRGQSPETWDSVILCISVRTYIQIQSYFDVFIGRTLWIPQFLAIGSDLDWPNL
jgi:hypothetical protein